MSYFTRVALRKESVDRNISTVRTSLFSYVALRKESVDRNSWLEIFLYYQDVALRKESVDRNSFSTGRESDTEESLSARRAWIEI